MRHECVVSRVFSDEAKVLATIIDALRGGRVSSAELRGNASTDASNSRPVWSLRRKSAQYPAAVDRLTYRQEEGVEATPLRAAIRRLPRRASTANRHHMPTLLPATNQTIRPGRLSRPWRWQASLPTRRFCDSSVMHDRSLHHREPSEYRSPPWTPAPTAPSTAARCSGCRHEGRLRH